MAIWHAISSFLRAGILYGAVICLIAILASSQLVSAVTDEQRRVFEKGISYFNYWNGCSDGSTTSGGSVAVGSAHSGEEVLKFAGAPLDASFGVSDEQAEQWFLSTNSYAVRHFGLNSGNIGEVTAAIKAQGVSPAFFYGYAVNEGGGAGGFINHYVSDAPGGAVGNATTDAKYLAEEASSTNGQAAYGGGEPASMPTAEAQAFYDGLPTGTIGKAYIPATSATTAEIEEYYGKFDTSTTRYSKPLASLMGFIEEMGGDPMDFSSATSGDDCDDSSLTASGPMQQRIKQLADEMASWGDSGSGTCYVFGGGHGDDASGIDAKINNKFQSGSGIDCSGFASSVIYKASGQFNMWSSASMCTDITNFEDVTSDPQPGDFAINCNQHVAIISEIESDGSITTAESSSPGCGVGHGPHHGHKNVHDFEKVLRYKGGGSE